MTMTEDQIIAEAKRLAKGSTHAFTLDTYAEAVARHALRLAEEPEQDPALVKATAVFDEAITAWTLNDFNYEAAARKIKDAYPVPSDPKFDICVGNMNRDYTVGLSELVRLVRGGARFRSIAMAGETK